MEEIKQKQEVMDRKLDALLQEREDGAGADASGRRKAELPGELEWPLQTPEDAERLEEILSRDEGKRKLSHGKLLEVSKSCCHKIHACYRNGEGCVLTRQKVQRFARTYIVPQLAMFKNCYSASLIFSRRLIIDRE